MKNAFNFAIFLLFNFILLSSLRSFFRSAETQKSVKPKKWQFVMKRKWIWKIMRNDYAVATSNYALCAMRTAYNKNCAYTLCEFVHATKTIRRHTCRQLETVNKFAFALAVLDFENFTQTDGNPLGKVLFVLMPVFNFLDFDMLRLSTKWERNIKPQYQRVFIPKIITKN